MIITVGGVKGGEGKSTLATNLAICRSEEGRDVLLVDADKQRSASDFTLVRKEVLDSPETGYTSIQLQGTAVRDEVSRLVTKYDDILIDVGGRDTVEQRAAIAISNIYAIPVVPSSYDLWALEQAAELVKEGRAFNPSLHTLCFLNKVPARSKEAGEARELIRDIPELTFIDVKLVDRKVWRDATAKGLSIIEYSPANQKAVDELWALYEALFDLRFDTKKKSKRRGK
jgi:chromosome partitioning protein